MLIMLSEYTYYSDEPSFQEDFGWTLEKRLFGNNFGNIFELVLFIN